MKRSKKQKKIARKIQKAKELLRYYNASQSSNYHKAVRGGGNSGDSVTHGAVTKLRAWARYLDENNAFTIGIHDNLVDRIVGAGLTIEPVVKRKNGNLWPQVNDQLRDLWDEFWERPEVTGELPGAEVERLLCRSWLRDGECLTKHIIGTGPSIQHNSSVPYSLELLEADYLPMDLNDKNVIHGVTKNGWGRPVIYNLFKEHPGNAFIPLVKNSFDTIPISADRITHLKFTRRFRQTRGVPVIHGIIHTLDDIGDYSESERIKARVGANFTSYIKRSPDYTGDVDENGNVPFEMQAGMIFDGLQAGEELGTIGLDTPNPNLGPFLAEMMRASASGTGTSYSSVSKHYDGTYSAQRQEMVESIEGYAKLRNYFNNVQMIPTWKRFIDMIITSRLFVMPAGVDLRQLYRAVDIRGPGVPWIDPKKEIEADVLAVDNGFESRPGVIRKRGGNPRLVDKELKADTFEPKAAQPEAQQPQSNDSDDSTQTDDDDQSDDETTEAA